MIRAVDKTIRVHPIRLHDQMRCRGQVAIKALAHRKALNRAGRHRGKAPNGDHAPPRIGRGEEFPVVHRLAEHRVGHVVRGECKVLNVQQHFTHFKRLIAGNHDLAHHSRVIFVKFDHKCWRAEGHRIYPWFPDAELATGSAR